MKKKLCFVVDLFPPKHKGGAETLALELSKVFSKYYDVHVVTKWHERLNENENLGFKIYGVKIKSKLFGIKFFETINNFITEIKKIDPDIIYARPFTPSGFISTSYSKKYAVPVVTQCDGGDIRPGWLNPYEKLIVKKVIKDSTRIISSSEEMKNIIARDFERKDVVMIPNGINLKEFNTAKPMILKYPKPRILFVGRMDEMKGTEYLIKAFLDIKYKTKGSLLLIGNGPLKNELSLKYENNKNVVFLGAIDHKYIASYMKASDIFVLPSVDEAMPVVLMEALASGLPIVASKVGGIPELIKKENGILTKPRNTKSISDAILKLLKNKKVMVAMSKRNKEKVKLKSWETVCKSYKRIFDSLINKG